MGKKIHLIGVGGVGMAALAVLLKSQGHDVSGCDISGSKRLDWLKEQGVRVFDSHSPEHIKDVDEVVVTPAVDAESAELVEARKMGRAIISRGFCLAQIASQRPTVAVCGSHGKTTTSTFIAKLLLALGEDVAWAIGGECGEMPVARAGKGVLVVEADESDATLVHYRVKTLVVNKCEYDHPDHFKSEEEYFNCFEIAKANAEEVIDSESLDLDGWVFPVAGEHNVYNALAAFAALDICGGNREKAAAAFATFMGAKRRMEFKKEVSGAKIFEDYAHHPTEITATIRAAKTAQGGRVICVFQPHTYSRTAELLEDFAASLSAADKVYLLPIYSARETDTLGMSSELLASKISGAYAAKSFEELAEILRGELTAGDTLLVTGAGDVIKLTPLL
jgi:UDP-N-acetylmuramate--alanine ligase